MPFAILPHMAMGSNQIWRHPAQRSRWNASNSRFARMVILVSIATSACAGQVSHKPARPRSELQQQYDAAQRAQASGDLSGAARDYQSFIAATLSQMAEAHVQVGNYPAAAKLFEEALAVSPSGSDSHLRLHYAEAALAARDLPKAKALAQSVLTDDPKNSEARLLLGEALLQTDENDEARKQLEAAVALEPNYKNGLALATAYLALSNTKDATRVFNEMIRAFGDKAAIHLDIGRALAEAGYPDLAIPEFDKAISKDPTLPEAHYCLGASYLLSQGDEGFPKAAKEFHRELDLHPKDYFSLSQLGYIAFSQHRLQEAEIDLRRAAALDPLNPDNPLLLGQVYLQLNQPDQAESSLRKAITLTTDLSRNHYQVQRAHYLLGHLLIRLGRVDEAKQEMQVSAALLKENMKRDQSRLQGATTGEATTGPPSIHPFNPAPIDDKTKQEVAEFASRVAPALADSYNNLGAIAAGSSEYATATRYFEKAAEWNPSLEGLDYNWGRAAFSAQLYAQAVPPLGRYLAANPQEQGARRVLGISFFMLKDYPAVLQTLRPIEQDLPTTPQLAYAFAQSLVLTGDYDHGVASLQHLSSTNPSIADVHRALGEAYASHGEYQRASSELHLALQLNPADSEVKDQLALVLVHLEKKSPSAQP
jgi:tetratricopeptide (TPR) repeat protein